MYVITKRLSVLEITGAISEILNNATNYPNLNNDLNKEGR